VHFLDQEAYECGVRLLSKADARLESTLEKLEPSDRKHGKERKPLFTWADLEEMGSKNVTMTTGCMIGVVQRHLKDNDDLETAQGYFEKMKSLVKPGNLYVELNPHETSKNWVEGVFLTMADGTTLKWYAGKKLRTNVGEIAAADLAKEWAKKDNEHKVLLGVKDFRTWKDLPPVEIRDVKHLEDYMQNECRPWAPDGDLQAGLNKVMRYLARKYDVPILIGDDSHYATPDEQVGQDVRLAQDGSWRFYGSYHRMSSDEAFKIITSKLDIPEAEFEEWIENSHAWAGRFKDFVFHTPPSLPTKFYEAEYAKRPWFQEGDHHNSLRYIFELIQKHGRMDWEDPAMCERLQQEIELLHDNGTIDLLPYFMVDEEVCSLYEGHGLLTGPGRGSAAGLILTYLLGITHVDPLKFGLSLERFITRDRIASGGLPDIDQDLPSRDLLDDPETGWLKKRFGDHYAQISVDSTLKLKMAVKDVSRRQRGFVPPDIEDATKKFLMPPQNMNDHDFVLGYEDDAEGHVPGSCERDPALMAYIKKYPEDWDIVKKCLGLPRQKGRHACAFVIANRPIEEFIPLTTVSDVRVTAYTAKSVEAVGGLKMDFLVINSLRDISGAIKLIQERHDGGLVFEDTFIRGRRVPKHRLIPVHQNGRWELADVYDLPEDQPVFADVATGETPTVFQFNTPGAVQWMEHFAHKKANGNYAIDSVEGMAAFTALDRPGPLDMKVPNPEQDGTEHNLLVEYARRAAERPPSPGVLKVFDELIPETYGVMVYQEQLQKMYQELTGCTGSEAENFRKLVAKKEIDKIQKMYVPFIEKASARMGEVNAKAAWDFFITWAKYGFNKSHAVCYAMLGYVCAYLKHHYPLEWWTAVLSNASKKEVQEEFWRHCGHLIDLPDVRLSGKNFEIQGERIRAPLSLMYGVGEAANEQLMLYAPYTDINDFCQKIDRHTRATGTMVPKKKTRKERWLNPDTNKKEWRPYEVQEMQLKRGHNSLNRGVVRALIRSGAMDSLFPPDTHMGEQLNMFEDAMAANTFKREKVEESMWAGGPVKRYQVRKKVLPAYSENLIPMFREQFDSNWNDGSPLIEWTPPNSTTGRKLTLSVVDADEIDRLQYRPLQDGQSITVAAVAYVDEYELKTYGKEVKKEMCKLLLDIGGGRYEFVQWPKKDSTQVADIYHNNLKGAIVVAILNRWKEDRPFSLSDVIILAPPIKEDSKEDKKEEKNEPENAE